MCYQIWHVHITNKVVYLVRPIVFSNLQDSEIFISTINTYKQPQDNKINKYDGSKYNTC